MTENTGDDALDERSVWDELLGPFYDKAGTTRHLRVSERELADMGERRQLLALTTSDGIVVYPAFQFDGPQLLPGLADVLGEFAGVPVDTWTLASWLLAPSESLDGFSVIDWLRAGHDPAPVRAHAADAARRWSDQMDVDDDTDEILSDPAAMQWIRTAQAEVDSGGVLRLEEMNALMAARVRAEERMASSVDHFYAGATPPLPIGAQPDDDTQATMTGIVDPVLAHLVARVDALDEQQLTPEHRRSVDEVRADLDAGKDMTADQVRQYSEHRANRLRAAADRVRAEDGELLDRLAAAPDDTDGTASVGNDDEHAE